MKKTLLLYLILLVALTGFSQEAESSAAGIDVSAKIADRATGCQQLQTLKTSATSNRGIVFNVVARQNIVITSLDNLFYEDSIWVHLYYKNGAYRGDTSQLQWTELDSVYIAYADTVPTRLPILINKPLATADTMAFLIMSFNGYSAKYGVGTLFNSISAQNSQVKVLEGFGLYQDFSITSGPRVFCGNVNYCPQGQALCAEDRYTANLATNNGVMTDIKANKNITISAVGVVVSNNTTGLDLYSKPKTHLGFEADSTLWTKIRTVNFPTVVGLDSLVMISLPTQLDLDSGTAIAYYFRISSGGHVKYLGPNVKVVTYPSFATELYQIMPVSGIAGSFYTNSYPRTFSGGIDACLRAAPNAINEAKKIQLSIYPNPANNVLNIATDEHEPVTLEVIDLQGRVVMSSFFLASAILDVASLPASVYQLYLRNINGTAVKRFMKN